MVALLEQNREALAQLCRQYGVERLEVFGSAARGVDFDSEVSDFDFIVRFNPHPTLTRFEQYFGLEAALEALLGRKVDLVMEGALKNPYFIQNVGASRELLYAA